MHFLTVNVTPGETLTAVQIPRPEDLVSRAVNSLSSRQRVIRRTASVMGVVRDTGGVPLPTVQVVILNLPRNISRQYTYQHTTTTAHDGSYKFEELRVGSWGNDSRTLMVEHAGHAPQL